MIAYESIFPSQGPRTNSDTWNIEQIKAHNGRTDARSLAVVHYCKEELRSSVAAARRVMAARPQSEAGWRSDLIAEIDAVLA